MSFIEKRGEKIGKWSAKPSSRPKSQQVLIIMRVLYKSIVIRRCPENQVPFRPKVLQNFFEY